MGGCFHVSNSDISALTMEGMFYVSISFNQDISNWVCFKYGIHV